MTYEAKGSPGQSPVETNGAASTRGFASSRLFRPAITLAPSLLAAGAFAADNASSTGANASSNPKKLSDIVVEEQQVTSASSPKLTEPLRDTPQTITVISQEVIQQQGATTLRDVLRNTPGITFQAGEGGTPAGDQLTVRGFSARTDLFVDGVRDIGGYSRDAFNLEQVEVTKGPSSSDAGRGSTGGSINLVSKTPKLTRIQNVDIGVGTDDYKRATIDVNEAIAESPLPGTAVRLNAMWQDSDVPGRDVAQNKSWAVAPSLAFGLNTPTRVTVSYLHMKQDNVPDYGIPWVPLTNTALAAYQGKAAPVAYSNFYGLKKRDYEKVDNDLATVETRHDFSNGFTLRNLSRYGRTRRDSIITSPRFLSDNATTIRRTDWKSRDQEDEIVANITNLSGSVTTGAVTHDLSAGLELTRETSRNFTRVKTGADSPNTDLYHPNPNDPYLEAIARNGAYTDGAATGAGIYAFDTVKLNSHWQANAGLRWDRFKATYNSIAANGVGAPLGRTDEMVSGKVGVVYKPEENGSIYAAYSTAFNPSAEGLALTTSTVNLKPEETRNYEVGTKWDLFNRNLSVTGAIFRTEKTNARTPGINAGDPPTVLAGKQRVDGIEVGVSGKLTRHWTAFGGYAFMDSKTEASNTAAEVDRDLSLTPKSTFNLWTTYELPGGVSVGAGAQYMDSVFRNAANTTAVPSYWLFNAMASYEVNSHLTLRLNVYNLADERYVDRVSGGHFLPGPARSATLTASLKF